jgi:tetratricopeptide (TPR) repeat protein
MLRLRWSLLFAFISILSTTVSHAQSIPPATNSRSNIYGFEGAITSDGDNRPIADARIELATVGGETISVTFSGDNGRFTFMNLPKGQYTITVTANGYESATQHVMIIGNNLPSVRMALRKPVNHDENTSSLSDSVSSRELMLPQKAQEAYHKGMDTLYKKNNPSGSLNYFQTVLKVAPNFYEAYYQEGMAYTIESNLDDAEKAFQAAIELSHDSYPDANFGLAAILSDHNRFKESEQLSRHGLLLQPDAWRGDFELARALCGLGQAAEAEQSALEARKRNPNFSGLYIVLANIHLRLQNEKALVEDLTEYLKIDPNGPFAPQARDMKEKTEKLLSAKGAPPGPHQN